MGFLDFLSAGLTAGTGAVGAYQQGQRQGEDLNYQRALEKHKQDQADAMQKAQMAQDALRGDELRQRIAAEQQAAKDAADRRAAQAELFARGQAADPTNPFFQGSRIEGVDYTQPYQQAGANTLKHQQDEQDNQRWFATLKSRYPQYKTAMYDKTVQYKDINEQLEKLEAIRANKDLTATQPQYQLTDKMDENGRPLRFEAHSGRLEKLDPATGKWVPAGSVAFRPRAGAASMQGVSPKDIEQQIQNMEGALTRLQGMKGLNLRGLQGREAIEYGTGVAAAKGQPSYKLPIAGAAMDALGLGTGQKGYNDYAQLQEGARAISGEITRLMGTRAGYQSMLQEVNKSAILPADFKNPELVRQKFQRLRTLLGQARQVAGIQMAPTDQAGGGQRPPPNAPPSGIDEEADAIIRGARKP